MIEGEWLKESVVAIQAPDGKILGSGFFIGKDGSILTCFHVLGSADSLELYQQRYKVSQTYSSGDTYSEEAECIYASEDFSELDVAILRVSSGRLPSGAKMLPLGQWEAPLEADREFVTFGFRSSPDFLGLYAKGVVRGLVTPMTSRSTLLQLSPQAPGQEEIRHGMSGAPVYYLGKQRIVGMITSRYRASSENEQETIPLAIPVELIAQIWQPLRQRFEKQKLYDELLHVLSPAGWFTNWALERLCQDLPPFFGVDCDQLDKRCLPDSLLQSIENKGRIYTFLHWLHRKYPEVSTDKLISPTPYFPFSNREYELRQIMGDTQYLVLDGPTGYGKTALLRQAEVGYSREQWLCVYVEIANRPADCTAIAVALQEAFGGEGVSSLPSLADMGRALGSQLSAVKKQLEVDVPHEQREAEMRRGIVLLLDNLERLDDGELGNLVKDMIPALFETLSDEGIRLRVRFAGRYISQRLSEFDVIQIKHVALTPFEFDVIRDTIADKAKAEPNDTLLRAAHLMHVSGGHPGCMARILSEMKYTWPPDLFFSENTRHHQRLVLDTARSVRDSLPREIRQSFDILSFYRRFNFELLDQIIERSPALFGSNSRDLANALTKTYLVVREAGFFRDEILRRLLTRRMFLEQPDTFLEGFRSARDLYHANLEVSDYYSHFLALESLYTGLHTTYFRLDAPGGQTLRLRGSTEEERLHNRRMFFDDDGPVARCLNLLAKKKNAPDVFADFELAVRSDDEFMFTVNHYLRGGQFSNDPVERLLQRIRQPSAYR
jgi:hypothetical protein